MFDKDTILALMRDGHSVDDIASSMATTLNEAAAEYTALQEAEVKKMEEEAARQYEAKREAVCMMLDGLVDFLVAAGEDELVQEIHNVEIDKTVKMIDSAIATFKKFIKLQEIEFMGTADLSDFFCGLF